MAPTRIIITPTGYSKGFTLTDETPKPTGFIHEAVAVDLQNGRFTTVRTRLPPEPNGYLHVGHIKAFLINYNIAKDFSRFQ